jgi:Zn-dependent protease
MSAHSHFRIAGIPVRVEPIFFVIAVLFGLRYDSIKLIGIWVACTFISILVHELGHAFALKAFGTPSAIVLHGFGGVTISRNQERTKARGVIVSLAGSIVALTLLWLPTRTLLGNEQWYFEQDITVRAFVYFLSFQNLWWSVANLLPIRPLDGGHVATSLFGLPMARRISIGAAVFGAVWAFSNDQSYAGFFALFLAFNNFQEIRAEQRGGDIDVFEVEAPEPGSGPAKRGGRGGRARGRSHLQSVPSAPSDLSALLGGGGEVDQARTEQQAWNALRNGDATTAHRLVSRLGSATGPYLRAACALAAGEAEAFALFEAAYAAHPGGPPNLVATELLARSGAATAVARRLVERPDGSGREGAATLQTHLHYAEHFEPAAEVGEAVFAANPPSPAQTAFEVACSWARAGELERSVDWLERAAQAGFKAASIVDGEPDLALVRADPRWPVLRAGLT